MKRLISILMLVIASLSASAYDDDAKYYCNYSTDIDGVYYLLNSDNKTAMVSYKYQEIIVQKGATFGEEWFISYHTDYSGDVHIPNEVVYEGETYSVTSISYYAFDGCCDLTSITIPNSVTSIGSSAFEGCSGLTSITIPNSVTSIGDRALYGCSGLTSITIPNNVTSIGGSAFYYCNGLTSIKVDSGNKKYDSRDDCNAIIETLTNTLMVGCKNTAIPQNVTSIGNSAFTGCCGLTSITIPNSVTSIGNYAFQYCTNLVYITFPSRLASIGNSVFYSCYNLIDVYCHAENVPSADNSSFSNSSNITLHIPYATLEAYKSTEPWNQFKAYVALSNGVSQGKCAKPTINIVDGKAVFNCETPSVSFHWSVSTSSGSSGVWNNSISLPITLNVFATKDGYENSDVATYEFFGINGDVNNDGEVNVADHVKLSEIIMNSNE